MIKPCKEGGVSENHYGGEFQKHTNPQKPINQVPENLKSYKQFVVWKFVYKPEKTKPDKIPFNVINGSYASTNNTDSWCYYAEAANALQTGDYDGIGFMFTREDPYVFLDMDDCANNGAWKSYAVEMCQALPSATWETSQSGRGLHALIAVKDKSIFSDLKKRWTNNHGDKYELYTADRFIAFGKCDWTRPDIPLLTEAETQYLQKFVPQRQSGNDVAVDWEQAAPDTAQDADIITCLLTNPPDFNLWNGTSQLGSLFPADDGKRAFDNSSAELSLANRLAILTVGNPAWVERLMNAAPLCQRDKWQNRASYRKLTIDKAVIHFESSRRKQRQKADQLIGDDLEFGILPEVLNLSEALDRFVYVQSGASVADRIAKNVLSIHDAERAYAASKLEQDNGKSVPIIKAWLSNSSRKSVDVLTWSPGDNEFCKALEHTQAGNRAYNLWTGLPILPAPLNWKELIEPFLDHVKYLVPVDSERLLFMHWLAHMFQKPEELPHIHFLMVTAQTGTGRGTLGSILTRALKGYVAANTDVSALFGGFNGRLSQKILCTVDEVREGISYDRYAKQESLKSKLTEEVRAINPKYGVQFVERNCTRFLMFSNHLDALPFDNSDRRIVVIENPCLRRAATEYKHLYDLMDDAEFIASVQKYLLTLDISNFNAFEPAPLNASKLKALRSLESDADRAAREFARSWPGEFAAYSDLIDYIGSENEPKSNARPHFIARAGLKTAHRVTVLGKKETILIVDQKYMPEDLSTFMNSQIVEKISQARMDWSLTT